ncbi:MAG: acyltransferase [Acidimicrobiales bacterium]|nr:acyltransferase [Acidimicrobiales bacterium]
MTVATTGRELFSFAAPDAGRRITYQPALDGIRGLAVGAVVLYHHDPGWIRGGYLGVDAFFVLSGFLITSLLLAEWRDTDTIDLLAFWKRRFRRLLPPLVLCLLGIAAYNQFLASPDVLETLRADSLATLFYVMNWRLIASSQSYFDQFYASPLRHMWSLSIEEQWYLIWPIVALALLRWRGSVALLLRFTLLAALASSLLMAALYDQAADPSGVYFRTDTRAQALLIGAALAAAVSLGLRARTTVQRRVVLVAATTAVVVLGWHWLETPATTPGLYRGGFTLHSLAVATIVFAVTEAGGNPLRSALSWRPLRALGLISYGVYVYHWPLFAVINAERTGWPPDSSRLLVARLVATLVVATASFVLVERPIRAGALGRLHLPRGAVPATVAVLVVLLVASTTGARATLAFPEQKDAADRPPPTVAVEGEAAAETKVLLVGDSVAYSLGTYGFSTEGTSGTTLAEEQGLALWNQAVIFCELIPAPRRENGEVRAASDTCANWEQDWAADIEVFDPDVALVQLGAWEIFDREIDGTWVEFGTPEFDARLSAELQSVVDVLGAGGAEVVFLTTPRFTRDDGVSAQEWTQNDVARTDHFNELLGQLAAANPDDVTLIELGAWLCPDNECREQIDGVEMRQDGLHFAAADGAVVANWLAPQLRELGGHGSG